MDRLAMTFFMRPAFLAMEMRVSPWKRRLFGRIEKSKKNYGGLLRAFS
jgi:hypothetical protein